ncbi:hypothetical protein QOT17_005896 [Balamuthia mandrillaris]
MKKKANSKKSRTRLERQRQRKAATVLARQQQQPTTTTTTKERLPEAKEEEGEDEVASAQARREQATNYLEAARKEQQLKQKQAWIDRRRALQRRGWPWTAVVNLQKPCHNYEDNYDPDLFCFWDVLPVELLVSVMQYLDVKSLLVLEQTCCVARDFLRDNQPLWRYIVHTEFGPPNRLPSDWRLEAIRLCKQWEKVSSGSTSLLVNQAVTTGMSVKVRSSLLLHRQAEKANKAGTFSLNPMQLFAWACKRKNSGQGSVATVRYLIQHFRQYISQEMQRSPSFVFPLFRCIVNLDDVSLLDTLKLEFGNLINSFVPPVVDSNDFNYWMDDDPFRKAVKHSCKRAAWWLWNNEKLLHASTEVQRMAAYLPVTAGSGDYELFRAVLHRLEVSVIKPEHFVEGDEDEWIQKHGIALPNELYRKWNAALIAASQGGFKMKAFTEVRTWITEEFLVEDEIEEEREKEANKDEEEVNEAKAPFTSYERIVEHMLFRSFLFYFGRLGGGFTSFAFDSPIEVACWAKQKRIFNMLLSAGNLRAMHQTTQFKTLKVIVQRGDVDMMDLCLAAADPLSSYEMAQIIDLAARKGNAAVLRHLLEKHRPRAIDLARVNPLHTACCFRRPSAVKTLLELGWDPNQSACLTRTPLQCALDGWSKSNGKNNKKHITAVVQLLLQAGAKVNVPYYYTGHTVLSRAADRGYPEVIKLLVEHGADVEETAPVTSTSSAAITSATRPLVAACLSLHLDCVEVLLQSGANPNRTQGEKKTILQLLAVHGDAALPIVRVLLCHGAEPDHVVKGKKPLLLAILTNEPSDNLVAELLRHGAQTDCLLALPVRLLKEEVQRRRKSRSGEITTTTEARSEKQPRHNNKKKEKQKQQSHNLPKEEWISLLLDYFRSLPVA